LPIRASKITEKTGTEIQVLGTTALTPVNNLGLTRHPANGNGNRLKTVRASIPRRCVQRDNKITVGILFAASTHPDSEVCKLPRGSLLEGL